MFPTIEDARKRARRRVPRLAFDYLEGGAGSEATLRRNLDGFAEILLEQHYLRDVEEVERSVSLFGRRYAEPFGISPIGLLNLIWPQGDLAFARTARARNIPYLISAAATTEMELLSEAAGGNAWFQLYVSTEDEVTFDLIERAGACGIEVLVVTVDLPAPARRLRDIRNGFGLPFRFTPSILADFASHPAWALATARHGAPTFRNMLRYMEKQSGTQSLAAFMARQCTARLDGAMLRRIRDVWPGKLVVKGVMSRPTLETALAEGADGIIVSNHGGRQSDYSPATTCALQALLSDGPVAVPVMIDSGIRSGADVIKAHALGADFAFAGRPFAYGLGVAGEPGVAAVCDLFADEIGRTLKQIGCTNVATLDQSYLHSQPNKTSRETR